MPPIWTHNNLQVPPFLTPLPDTLLMKISTQNAQGIFLGVKKHHPWHQVWPCPPSLWSRTLSKFQYPPSCPTSWSTSNKDNHMKVSEYLPKGLLSLSMSYKVIGSKDQIIGQRHKWWAKGQPNNLPQELEWRGIVSWYSIIDKWAKIIILTWNFRIWP